MGGGWVVVVVSTREKQKTKGKQKKKNKHPNIGGFSCLWFDQRNSKKWSGLCPRGCCGKHVPWPFWYYPGRRTTISTARRGML